MAQRPGAGVALRPSGHADDHGWNLYPSSSADRMPRTLHPACNALSSNKSVLCEASLSRRSSYDQGRESDAGPASPPHQDQFFIIREATPAVRGEREGWWHFPHGSNGHLSTEPAPVACSMERTNSGRMIVTELDSNPSSFSCLGFSPQDDLAAANRVRQHMANPRRNVELHERILRSLIHPKIHKGASFRLDDSALASIFRTADEIFFSRKLSRRVQWEWSSSEQDHDYSRRIIGTTALRKAPPPRGGYETLVVLSSPILTDTQYNRRLLISTFLHELIHSYLFICCGFQARHRGGHTDGFKEIAAMIDDWAGRGTLRLCDMEADLDHFRDRETRHDLGRHENAPWTATSPVIFHGTWVGGTNGWKAGGTAPSLCRQPPVIFDGTWMGGANGWEARGMSPPLLEIFDNTSSTYHNMHRDHHTDNAVSRML